MVCRAANAAHPETASSLASPLAKGLFHNANAQSPYSIPSHTVAKVRETGSKVATALNLDGAAVSAAAELRRVPADAFDASQGNVALPLSLTPHGGRAPRSGVLGALSRKCGSATFLDSPRGTGAAKRRPWGALRW